MQQHAHMMHWSSTVTVGSYPGGVGCLLTSQAFRRGPAHLRSLVRKQVFACLPGYGPCCSDAPVHAAGARTCMPWRSRAQINCFCRSAGNTSSRAQHERHEGAQQQPSKQSEAGAVSRHRHDPLPRACAAEGVPAGGRCCACHSHQHFPGRGVCKSTAPTPGYGTWFMEAGDSLKRCMGCAAICIMPAISTRMHDLARCRGQCPACS